MARKLDCVTVNPEIMNGQPCIRGMRLTVRRVVEAVALYPGRNELKAEYPELSDEDIAQALEFAARNLDDQALVFKPLWPSQGLCAEVDSIMSRNSFLDLDFPPEKATALHIRAQLSTTLEHHIEQKRWTQTAAARALKVPQPTIRKIVSGTIEKLSIEFLIKLMVRTGLPVGIAGGRISIGRSGSGRRGAQHAPVAA